MRACELVFNSDYFKGKVRVPSNETIVEYKTCHKKQVAFRKSNLRAQIQNRTEWMIRCNMWQDPNDESQTYFLSIVDIDLVSTDVFAYHQKPNGIFLVNVFGNMRF